MTRTAEWELTPDQFLWGLQHPDQRVQTPAIRSDANEGETAEATGNRDAPSREPQAAWAPRLVGWTLALAAAVAVALIAGAVYLEHTSGVDADTFWGTLGRAVSEVEHGAWDEVAAVFSTIGATVAQFI